MALDGMVLLSPVPDFGWRQQPVHAPLPTVSLLPSLAAAAMEEDGTFSEEALRAAEAYAEGQYITDLLQGVHDQAALDRIVERVTDFTSLDRSFVERAAGRIDRYAFAREVLRDEGRLASPYDTTIATADPAPGDPTPFAPDPVLDAMTARTATYRGGHMFYLRPESRRAFRENAVALYQAEAKTAAVFNSEEACLVEVVGT